MILCSPARNPDGTLVRPTVYEINHAIVVQLILAAAAVGAVVLLLALVQRRRPSGRRAFGVAGVGILFMLMHPLWTVSTIGGDCGELQVLCSWAVLGVELVLVGVQLVLLVWRPGAADPDRIDYDDHSE